MDLRRQKAFKKSFVERENDVDMNNHGNPKEHPEVPHEHKWKYDSGKPVRK